jgi:hypothetical protein
VWVSVGSGGLKNTKNTERTQRFILVRAIGALRLAADDPCTQEYPKSGVTIECKRDLAGDHSKLILGSLAVRSLPRWRGRR